MNDLNKPQPAPVASDSVPVWESVIADMRARDHAGRAKYGVPLQHDNGRDHLVDAYQESLDLVVYLRAEIERRADAAPGRVATFIYVNHRGEQSTRRVKPLRLRFAEVFWHKGSQWLLEAFDFDKQENRTFAMSGISAWKNEEQSPAPPPDDGPPRAETAPPDPVKGAS